MLVRVAASVIYDLSKQQAEQVAYQLGLSTDGTLDSMRKRVKEKWTAIKAYLPSQSAAKSPLVTKPDPQTTDSFVREALHSWHTELWVISGTHVCERLRTHFRIAV